MNTITSNPLFGCRKASNSPVNTDARASVVPCRCHLARAGYWER
jgi:hypothetical protein